MSMSKAEILYEIIFERLPSEYNKPLIEALGELGELAETAEAKDAEIAALREALDKCHELTYSPIALTQHLNKALEATK